jgi:hypothetical protein
VFYSLIKQPTQKNCWPTCGPPNISNLATLLCTEHFPARSRRVRRPREEGSQGGIEKTAGRHMGGRPLPSDRPHQRREGKELAKRRKYIAASCPHVNKILCKIRVPIYSEIFLINNCQCQNEVKNHTVPF